MTASRFSWLRKPLANLFLNVKEPRGLTPRGSLT